MTLYNETAPILVNEEMGCNIWLMTVKAPRIAATARPGQFVHVRIPGMDDHILRRPLGIYARNREEGTVDMMYQVLGFGTDRMTQLAAGESVELIGAIGRGWEVPEDAKRALVVAGGVGSAPLYPLIEELTERGVEVHAVLGASTVDALVARERYEGALGCAPACSTDDGTYARHGFVTDVLKEQVAGATGVAACGPKPMLKAIAAIAKEVGVPCQVSMEERMGCGIGACLVCACALKSENGETRYGHVCKDGPVFNAEEVEW